jgi:hypothetical protein
MLCDVCHQGTQHAMAPAPVLIILLRLISVTLLLLCAVLSADEKKAAKKYKFSESSLIGLTLGDCNTKFFMSKAS